MYAKLCRSTCCHHQLRNTVIQKPFTHHCLHFQHRPTLFRLQKISNIQNELEREAYHYRQVAKKYKKTYTIAHASAFGLGAVTAALSLAGIATAVTGIGAFASVSLGAVAAIGGVSSTLLTG